MVRGVIGIDDVFDSLTAVGYLSKPVVFSRTDTTLLSLTAELNDSIGYYRAFSTIYSWNGRAKSKNFIRFEGFVGFVVRSLDGF